MSLEALSREALAYAALCDSGNQDRLSARLYGFHRYALSPKLVMGLPTRAEIAGIVAGTGVHRLLNGWRRVPPSDSRATWMHWARRDAASSAGGECYKLYISPAPCQIRDALTEALPVVADSAARHFKVGGSPLYLARPDKFIAYFDDADAMRHVASALASRLSAMSVHGVPFTCAIDEGGLLSWGIDPPARVASSTSWRVWLCAELAQAMTKAGAADRVAAAYRRAEALGVDPVSWAPKPDIWSSREAD